MKSGSSFSSPCKKSSHNFLFFSMMEKNNFMHSSIWLILLWCVASDRSYRLCIWVLLHFGLDTVQNQRYSTMEAYFGPSAWLGSGTNVKLSSLGIQSHFSLAAWALRTIKPIDKESRWFSPQFVESLPQLLNYKANQIFFSIHPYKMHLLCMPYQQIQPLQKQHLFIF